MYIIIDDRDIITAGGCVTSLIVKASRLQNDSPEFREWIGKISDTDISAVEAFLIGDCNERESFSRIRFASAGTHRSFVSMTVTRSTIHCAVLRRRRR